jgi:hypothetical protein
VRAHTFDTNSLTAVKQKKNPKPRIKMKQMNWTKVGNNKIPDTYWEKLNDELIRLDLDLLEEMFAAKEIEKKDTPIIAKKTKQTLIDAKRANNLAITLSRFKDVTYPKIRESILKFDESVINAENATALLEYIPTKEEITVLNEYKGPTEELGTAERFLLEMLKVPNYEERLRSIQYKLTFDEQVQYLQPDIQAVLFASKQVRSSNKFKKILEIILAIGNYLNGGGFRGGAFGFTMDTLNKLKDTKSVDNKKTLIHYIIMYLQKDLPEIMDWYEDLPQMKHASRGKNFS